MKKDKLLIAGGGYAEVPLIEAAQKLGFYVITTGNRPEDLGHKYSDEFVIADFSDKKAMLALAKDLNIDALCPCANDFSALSCAYVAEQLGFECFDSYEVTKILHHKDSYRKFALENKISSPKAVYCDEGNFSLEYISNLNYPLIVKPVDMTGGKGIVKVNSDEETLNAVEKAFQTSRVKRIIVEDYIEGSNHGFSCFIRDGKVVFYFVDNEDYYLNKYMVSGASTPGDVPDKAINMIVAESEKIATLLKLKDGIFHIQFVLKVGIPYIIEICRRPPGDLYIDFVKHATGVDYPAYIIKAFANMDLADMTQVFPEKCCTRHCVMTDKNGIVKDIIFDKLIKDNIIEKFMWWRKGDIVSDFMIQKFGIVVLKYNSVEEMNKKNKKINKLIRVELL